MARTRVIPVNIPMADAIERMITRGACPICELPLAEHSAIAINEKTREVVTCSNDFDRKRRKDFLGK